MNLAFKLIQELTNFYYKFYVSKRKIEIEVNLSVPFVCQFALPDHAELCLKNKLHPKDDPYWGNTGAPCSERYAQWAFTMCGMASTAMILWFFKNKYYKPLELAEDALRHGVYLEDNKIISGMKYREYSLWVKNYGLKAIIYTRLNVRGIQHALSNGKLVIVSVNPNIRGYRTSSPLQKGGHLVVIVGYDLNSNTISINNPAGFTSTDTQVKHVLSISQFERHYAGRGLVVSPV